jgi:hypothetical protein
MVEDVVAYHITMAITGRRGGLRGGGPGLRVPRRPAHGPGSTSRRGRSCAGRVRTIEVVSKTQVEIGTLAIPLAKKIAADGFKVVLSGEGADELFGGYGTLARKATADGRWVRERAEFLAKMGRSDLMRVNKALMSAGVEPRTPFLDVGPDRVRAPVRADGVPSGEEAPEAAARGSCRRT